MSPTGRDPIRDSGRGTRIAVPSGSPRESTGSGRSNSLRESVCSSCMSKSETSSSDPGSDLDSWYSRDWARIRTASPESRSQASFAEGSRSNSHLKRSSSRVKREQRMCSGTRQQSPTRRAGVRDCSHVTATKRRNVTNTSSLRAGNSKQVTRHLGYRHSKLSKNRLNSSTGSSRSLSPAADMVNRMKPRSVASL